ncbi:hypothetical protein Glove_63g24 [Diversispora epigaea]|uniref:Uncharacterized protein n=1 Tax=Diversispora epigaea TaxID=1348612 RepID=A0A397JEV7_9GLOM|nr:hypothetical protein Glove_63g24 [Diversispora epigaea]
MTQFDNVVHKCSNCLSEIKTVAGTIFGIRVNAATVERLRSRVGFYHTNGLKYTRVLVPAKLRKYYFTFNRYFPLESNIVDSTLDRILIVNNLSLSSIFNKV